MAQPLELNSRTFSSAARIGMEGAQFLSSQSPNNTMNVMMTSSCPPQMQPARFRARSNHSSSKLHQPVQSAKTPLLDMSSLSQHPSKSWDSLRSRPQCTCPTAITFSVLVSASSGRLTRSRSCASKWPRS
eukprot:7565-Pyramimonas_sp.AAC.1